MIGIYKITSPSNKVYIGQSIDIEKRFKNYQSLKHSKGQVKVNRSLIKHGVENHTFEVLEECSIELLNERERYYQELFDCVEKGLNCRYTKTTDKSGKMSEESRLKMSLSSMGQKPTYGMKGKKMTDESKNKIRLKALGHKRNVGLKRTEEYKLKLSKSKIGNKSKSKIILHLETGVYYYSAKELCDLLNINSSYFKLRLRGIRENNTGYIYA